MYVSGRTPPRTRSIPGVPLTKSVSGVFAERTPTVKLPAAQVREIVKAVMNDPRIVGAMTVLGMNRATVEKSAMQKLGSITMKKVGNVARVRELEKKLAAEPNPVQQVELRRQLAFAKLEGGSK